MSIKGVGDGVGGVGGEEVVTSKYANEFFYRAMQLFFSFKSQNDLTESGFFFGNNEDNSDKHSISKNDNNYQF